MSVKHTITIEVRKPKTAFEKSVYGTTLTTGNNTKIFIKHGQTTQEYIDTFYHEIAHAFNHISGYCKSEKKEESLARLIGNIVEPCYRVYKKGKTSEYKFTKKRV